MMSDDSRRSKGVLCPSYYLCAVEVVSKDTFAEKVSSQLEGTVHNP